MKKSVGIILAVLLVVSLAGNGYQYTLLQSANEKIAASTVKTDELSAKVAELELTKIKQEPEEVVPPKAPDVSSNSPWIVGPDGIPVKNPYFDPELPTTIPEDPATPADGVVPPANEVVPPAVVPPAVVPPAKPDITQDKPGVNTPSADLSTEQKKQRAEDLFGKPGEGGGGTLTNPDDEGLIHAN